MSRRTTFAFSSQGIARLLSLALGVTALSAIDGCNAFTGVEDYEFEDRAGDASAAGSGGADASPEADAQGGAAGDAAGDAKPEADATDDVNLADASDAADAYEAAETGDAPDEALDASEDAADAHDAADSFDGSDATAADAIDATADGIEAATDAAYEAAADAKEAATGEICSGGIDDDNDGRIDCFDTECYASPSCDGTCSDSASLACGSVVTGKNTGGAGSTQHLAPPAYSCTTGSYPGPERAFKFTGAAGQNVFAEIYGLGADLAVFAVNPTAGGQCNGATSCATFGDLLATSNAEALGFAAEAGKDYYIVVDGPAAANFSLSLQCAPTNGCFPAVAIQSGQTITASNQAGSGINVTTKVSHHAPFATSGWLAPEAAYIFTPTATASYTITAKGPGGGGQFDCDLDMFLLAATECGENSLYAGATTGQKAETITFDGVADTSYYIVIDGYATSGVPCVTNFVLSITSP